MSNLRKMLKVNLILLLGILLVNAVTDDDFTWITPTDHTILEAEEGDSLFLIWEYHGTTPSNWVIIKSEDMVLGYWISKKQTFLPTPMFKERIQFVKKTVLDEYNDQAGERILVIIKEASRNDMARYTCEVILKNALIKEQNLTIVWKERPKTEKKRPEVKVGDGHVKHMMKDGNGNQFKIDDLVKPCEGDFGLKLILPAAGILLAVMVIVVLGMMLRKRRRCQRSANRLQGKEMKKMFIHSTPSPIYRSSNKGSQRLLLPLEA